MTSGHTIDGLAPSLRALRDEFAAFTEPHRPALWQYCLRLTGSPWDAEDLVQETLLRAFARLCNFWQPLTDARAYLFRIASNSWIDGLRRGAVPLDPLDDALAVASNDDPSLRAEAMDAMNRLLLILPPRQRAIVLLADVFDFTASEIGAMIGATEGAVRSALHRARETLKGMRGAAMESVINERTHSSEMHARVLSQFVDAFNRRDADAIVALLDVNASTDIVHIGEEHGRDVIREQSLREGFENPGVQRAELRQVAGVPVVLIFVTDADTEEAALVWMIRLGIVEDRICSWRSYYFTPDLISYVARKLGVSAAPAGYNYVAPLT